MKEVSHDAFARESIIRKNESGIETCSMCGNARKTPSGKRYLYRYGVEHDDKPGRIAWDDRKFCCKACRDGYYGS